jgi:hypothetical protein
MKGKSDRITLASCPPGGAWFGIVRTEWGIGIGHSAESRRRGIEHFQPLANLPEQVFIGVSRGHSEINLGGP